MPQAPNQDTHTGPSFSFGNRFMRFIWNVTYVLLFKFSPRPFHAWRSLLLTLFGAKMGKGCHIYPGVKIWAPWNLTCEDQAGVADGAILYSQAAIHLGYRCVISQGAHLCTGSHDYTQAGFPLYAKPIHVGAQAWVAAEAFVHPGITISEGSVIGARSVVTQDIPAWKVCTGHPCQVIKDRTLVKK